MSGDQTKPGKASAAEVGSGGRGTAAADAAPRAAREDRAPSDGAAVAEDSPSKWQSWSNLWQVPSIAVSAVLIVVGIYAASGPAQVTDFEGALTQVDQIVAAREFERAATLLRDTFEPVLSTATGPQQAHYHATAGDLVFLSQLAQDLNDPATNKQVIDQYTQAKQLGLSMSPQRLENWAETSLALGDLDGARKRLAELDSLDRSTTSQESGSTTAPDNQKTALVPVHEARNRVFRRLVEYSLRQPDLSFEDLMQTLIDYRMDKRLSAEDEVWAIARQTELRLESGFAQQGIDVLLIEMRRLENVQSAATPINFGELYLLLGRGYYELGDYARAQSHLERALGMFEEPDPARGDTLALLGQIAISAGDLDGAFEQFQLVVRDFVTTRSYLPGLLGRAEVQAVLGEHEASLADYRALRVQLPKAGPRRDLTAQRIAQSLCDRHDAALAMGKLDRALEYVSIAEGLFSSDQAPIDVLFRLALTSRQIADNLITQAGGEPGVVPPGSDPLIDPVIRHDANVHYEQAGQYYLRHSVATSTSVAAASQDDWATSMWMAADSFDRGGRQDLAIAQFLRYLDSRSIDDPRRAETLFRIGQAHQALMEYDKAITFYEQLVSDRAHSPFAAQSYVPLARCYMAVGRRPEAQQQLRQVLAGDRLLKPDARDYRDALIELGRINYQGSEFIAAIEQFAEAVQRYPDDPRRLEMQFLLADSYRGNAMAIAEKAKREPALSPAEMARLDGMRTEQLQTAQQMFATLCDGCAQPGAPKLSLFQQDLLRRAHLYRADCAFSLAQYEQAAELYDSIARQWSSHHSSMYALVQIVNCYSALGDAERSAAAHRRALVRLKQLPDNAFAAPDALMDRAAWERWLENTPLGPSKTASANASTG